MNFGLIIHIESRERVKSFSLVGAVIDGIGFSKRNSFFPSSIHLEKLRLQPYWPYSMPLKWSSPFSWKLILITWLRIFGFLQDIWSWSRLSLRPRPKRRTVGSTPG